MCEQNHIAICGSRQKGGLFSSNANVLFVSDVSNVNEQG